MKKLTKPIVVFLFAMTAVIGCKRETLTGNSPNQNQVAGEGSKNSSSSKVIYKATDAERAAAKAAWLAKARSEKSNILNRGGCGEHISHLIFVYQVTGSCGSSTLWDIDYDIYSYDDVGSGFAVTPVSASFTDMYFGSPITATLVNSGYGLVDPFCSAWQWDGYCEMVRYYQYHLTNVPAPSSAWPGDIGDFSLDLLSGFADNCTPVTVSGDMKGGITAAEYASSPASINVSNAAPHQVFVTTDCSLLCPPPTVQCPTGGTFQYWPQGSPPGSTVSIPWNGMFINNIPTGNYDYSAVLTYNIGGTFSSQPKTGSFSIP